VPFLWRENTTLLRPRTGRDASTRGGEERHRKVLLAPASTAPARRAPRAALSNFARVLSLAPRGARNVRANKGTAKLLRAALSIVRSRAACSASQWCGDARQAHESARERTSTYFVLVTRVTFLRRITTTPCVTFLCLGTGPDAELGTG
jgi:hypothetical protein